MAATLTSAGELTYASFPIDKVETDADGDLIVYGKASDGSVDSDQQIVAPSWMTHAAQAWKESGANLRVQHNAQRDPAGVGLEVETDASGATWVKGLVVEPVAKRLVAKGALRAYSVGIAHPTIERDVTGKARGGIITGGELVEISLVDRPANKRCGIQLVKSEDGVPEYVGKVFGDGDVIAKALDGEVLEKAADADTWSKAAEAPAPGAVDISNFQMPQDLSVSITPNDIMRVMQQKFVSQHYDELAVKAVAEAEAEILGKDHREFSADQRREQASAGNALPDGSYPIPDKDALRRAAILARSGHGNVAAARRLISRRARELGVANPLDQSDDVSKSETVVNVTVNGDLTADKVKALTEMVQATGSGIAVATPAAKESEPDLTKSCSACAKGNCDGASCSCGNCTDGKCACGKPAEKAADAPEPKQAPVKKAKGKGKKKLPPWLNKPADGDSDDDGKGSDDGDKSAEPEVCKHVWQIADPEIGTVECSKCHTPPSVAAGVTAAPMNPAPVGELMESDGPVSTKGATPASASGAVAEHMAPVPRHREPDGAPMEALEADAGMSDGDDEKPTRLEAATGMKAATTTADLAPDPEVAALLRFKATGTDEDLGRLHDLTCPAYHPEQVAKYHPYAELRSLIDSGAWNRKALAAAAGPLEAAREMQDVWQAANLLKAADPADLNQWRLELHKAFRDANPGPGSFPTPGCVSPQPYNRPVLTDGRAANGVGYDGPNSSPQVATSPPNAQHFDRPPLEAGHQSPSPSFMKASFEYPSEQGRPTQLNYAMQQKEQARQALVRMHHHLARQFPEACPITLEAGPVQQENHPVPSPAGIGKGEGVGGNIETSEAAPAAALKATPEAGADLFADADVYKGFKKMRKKLGKKVLSGSMTVDEARAKLGRQFAQKGAEPPAEAVQKGAQVIDERPEPVVYTPKGPLPFSEAADLMKASLPVAASFDPEVIKAAVAEATAPLLERLEKQQGEFTTKLAEQQKVIDAIADQPDPSTAAFSGLAFQPAIQKSRRPAAVPDQAEFAARAQEMVRRNLTHTYQTHSDPSVREAASSALANLGVGMEAPPMT